MDLVYLQVYALVCALSERTIGHAFLRCFGVEVYSCTSSGYVDIDHKQHKSSFVLDNTNVGGFGIHTLSTHDVLQVQVGFSFERVGVW